MDNINKEETLLQRIQREQGMKEAVPEEPSAIIPENTGNNNIDIGNVDSINNTQEEVVIENPFVETAEVSNDDAIDELTVSTPLKTVNELEEEITVDKSPNARFKSFEKIPPFYQKLCDNFPTEYQEMMLLSLVTTVSTALSKVYGLYLNEKIYINLYAYVLGAPGSGKANCKWAERLAKDLFAPVVEVTEEDVRTDDDKPLIEKILEEAEQKTSSVNEESTGKSCGSPMIPANITGPAFVQLLESKGGKGFMFETEADVLGSAINQKHGALSENLRKAFHGETISSYRKTEKEYMEIMNPYLSILFTSTPDQIGGILKSGDNGLVSRFLFHILQGTTEFANVFEENTTNPREELFAQANKELRILQQKLNEQGEIRIKLTEDQQVKFVEHYRKLQATIVNFYDEGLDGTVKRAGLQAFRIMSNFTILRNMDSIFDNQLFVCDDDFNCAIELVDSCLSNVEKVMLLLPKHEVRNKQELINNHHFYNALPNIEFTTAEAKKIGSKLNVSNRTVDRLLATSAFFTKVSRGVWLKAEI